MDNFISIFIFVQPLLVNSISMHEEKSDTWNVEIETITVSTPSHTDSIPTERTSHAHTKVSDVTRNAYITQQAVHTTSPPVTAASSEMFAISEKPVGNFELTLKACCGSNCVIFDNMMSMVGLQCCGETPMNAFERICCKNQLHLRHAGVKYFDRCCDDKPYAWDQVCCRGKVYDGVPQASCCGDVPYSIYDRSSICCGDQLHKIPPGTGSAVCCGENMYDDRAGTHFCCGDHLYSRMTHNGCCHPFPGTSIEYPMSNPLVNHESPPTPTYADSHSPVGMINMNVVGQRARTIEKSHRNAEGYNSSSQMCCDRVYDKLEYDFCCYVADVNAKHWTPPNPKPYNSKTHCCDGMAVLEVDQTTKKCAK